MTLVVKEPFCHCLILLVIVYYLLMAHGSAGAVCSITELEDKYEVVCIGKPLTAAEKQAIDDEEVKRESERKTREKANVTAVKNNRKLEILEEKLPKNRIDYRSKPRTLSDQTRNNYESSKQPASVNSSLDEAKPAKQKNIPDETQ